MKKTKVLFVVGGLHRAGAERFAYEIDRALNKDKFELSIFCLERKANIPKNFEGRYYEKKHQELGTNITYSDLFLNQTYSHSNFVINRIKRKLFSKHGEYWSKDLYRYLNNFDVIHWMGEYTFIHSVNENILNKSLIHMMSARFQNEHLYDAFLKDKFYHFCTPFKDNEIAYELYQFKDYDYFHLPLVLNLEGAKKRWTFSKSKTKKIGIFTRLNIYKPLDPFFYSFQVLLDKFADAELHIFGAGNPRTDGMYAYLDRLGIQGKVFFRGHQEDIVKTALDEQLSLSWFQGYNNDRPAGYAGIDMTTIGIPLVCWDFHPKPDAQFNETFPHYKNMNQFVSKTIEVLTNQEVADELSNMQFQDTLRTRNVDNYINRLEKEYIKISKNKK